MLSPLRKQRMTLVTERPIEGFDGGTGESLACVVEAHPVLSSLLDFSSVDPAQVAVEVGMVYPYEEDGADDLADLDFGLREWFEPAAGLASVRRALDAVHRRPQSIAEAIYDPTLRPVDVVRDLEIVEQALLLAQQQETRFHFVLNGGA